MSYEHQDIYHQLLPLNEDEQFYKEYYFSSRNEKSLKEFLSKVDKEDAIRRHLIIPEILPEIISYEMNDEEYFTEGDDRNVYISIHNRYTPAFMHRHNFFEIVFVYNGYCTQNIGVNRRTFTEGDIIFIAPGVYHTMEVFNDRSIIFNVLLQKKTFHQMFLPLAKGRDLQSQFFKEGLYNHHQLEYLAYHTEDFGKKFILKMYYQYLYHDEFSDQILIGILTYMNATMMRRFQNSMESSYSSCHTNQSEDFLVLNYIQDHIDTVSLSEVADRFGFSLSYCSKLIKNTTGISFNDWKRTLRIRQAEHMLINTNDTINKISLSLGYENTETFIRAFKRETHMTPSQYRKQSKKFFNH